MKEPHFCEVLFAFLTRFILDSIVGIKMTPRRAEVRFICLLQRRIHHEKVHFPELAVRDIAPAKRCFHPVGVALRLAVQLFGRENLVNKN
jgi:hypothetical protein